MSIADEREHLARKIWRPGYFGWSYPHWDITKREAAILAYWERKGHIERDDTLIRLTDVGRAALGASRIADPGQPTGEPQ